MPPLIAAMIGGYMAMNIGANDVAYNVEPAVGSKALTLTGAIIIAAIFEASGAFIAGGDVESTIKKGIIDAISSGGIATKAAIPIWVMAIGALGIVIGLALFGPKLIRTVGQEITELDQMRAFCIAMAASITVIIASQLGLPVSSTHIAIGGIFGVGFLREYLKSNYAGIIREIEDHHTGKDQAEIGEFMTQFEEGAFEEKRLMIKQIKQHRAPSGLTKSERKAMKKVYREELVKRSAFVRIVAAWLITVPASGLLAAMLFFTIRGMMLPNP